MPQPHSESKALLGPELPVHTPGRTLAAVLRGVFAVLCWALFAFWWWLVLQPSWSPSLRPWRAAAILAVAVLVIASVSTIWVAHNVRIARGDRRWKLALWSAPVFRSDYLGRAIHPPINEELRSAPLVELQVVKDQKKYTSIGRARAAKGGAQ